MRWYHILCIIINQCRHLHIISGGRKMSSKRTLKAFLTSVLALVLCFSMLVSTTFAWFTDTAESGLNKIVAGNLDVEVYYGDPADEKSIQDVDTLFNDVKLWEPGAVAFENITVANEGNLAFKYLLEINFQNENTLNGKGLSEVLKVAVVDEAIADSVNRDTLIASIPAADWQKLENFSENGNIIPEGAILPDAPAGSFEGSKTYGVVIYWQPTANDNDWNVNNGKTTSDGKKELYIDLGISVYATQLTAENDSFDHYYDENAIIATTAAEAQEALDNAAGSTVIKLAAGVNYGTLTIRRAELGTVVDITDMGGDAAGNEKYRDVGDVTILGAPGATVDKIDFATGWIGSESCASYIEIDSLTLRGVTFSGTTTPVSIDGSKGGALGIGALTLDDCTMVDAAGTSRFVFQQISGYKELKDKTTNEYVMTAGVKNLTITNCEVTGAYQVAETRAMENITVTGNTFTGIKARDLLITSDVTYHADKTYTGAITITGNTSTAGEERFIRASLNNSDVVVTIKDNTITNYLGADPDYIKVDGIDSSKVTNTNNNLVSIGVKDAAAAQTALDNAAPGTTIQLQPDMNYGTLKFRANPGNSNTTLEDIADAWAYNYNRSIENVTILGAAGAKVDGIIFETGAQPGDCNNRATVKNLVIDGVEFTDAFAVSTAGYNAPVMITTSNATVDGLTVKNCTLIGNNDKLNLVYLYGADGSKNVTLTGNTVDGICRLCELRGTENVTITNNIIKNTAEHGILLAGSGYSGNVTITGNTAESIGDRFVRMAGADNATIVIKDNTITKYLGGDADVIKVTKNDNTNITASVASNNTVVSRVIADAAKFKEVVKAESDGETIILKAGTYTGLEFTNPANFNAKNLTIVGEEGTIIEGFSVNGWSATSNIVIDGLTFKNVTFLTSGLLLSTASMTNVTVEDCDFLNNACIHQNDKTEKLTNLTVKGCNFNGVAGGANTITAIMLENTENVVVSRCTFTDIQFNVLQAGILAGTVEIDGNKVNGTGDRVFRFVDVANADITISNNTITSDGDDNGELAKSSNASEITLRRNTWNGKSDAQVAAKLINITAK